MLLVLAWMRDMILDEVNTSTTKFLAGQEYEIVSMGTSDGAVAVSYI